MITISRQARRLRCVLGVPRRAVVPPLVFHARGTELQVRHRRGAVAVEVVDAVPLGSDESIGLPLDVLAEFEGRDDSPVVLEALAPDRTRVRWTDHGVPQSREFVVPRLEGTAPSLELPAEWTTLPSDFLAALAEASETAADPFGDPLMPLKLNVGVSRKLGLPEYSSVGASCNVEVELDASLLQTDLDGFHTQVRDAFTAACQAVDDELVRLQSRPALPVASHVGASNGATRRNGATEPSHGVAIENDDVGRRAKPATANQVRALVTMARWRSTNLKRLLRDEYDVARPEELSLTDASRLIDRLKAAGES